MTAWYTLSLAVEHLHAMQLLRAELRARAAWVGCPQTEPLLYLLLARLGCPQPALFRPTHLRRWLLASRMLLCWKQNVAPS